MAIVHSSQSSVRLILRILDVFIPFGMLYISTFLNHVPWTRAYILLGVLASLMLAITLRIVNAYQVFQEDKSYSEAISLIRAWTVVLVSLLALGWATQSTDFYSRLVLGFWSIAVPIFLIVQHLVINMVARKMLGKRGHLRRAIIVGTGSLGKEIYQRIVNSEIVIGIKIVGFIDNCNGVSTHDDDIILGDISDLRNVIARNQIELVFLALPMNRTEQILEAFEVCQQTTVSVMLVPDLFMFELRDARHQDIAGMPVFVLNETPFWGVHGVAKRIEDLILASLSLLFLWPIFVIIAIGVKLSSPGPILFRQRRHGLDDTVFHVYKFRTMTVCEDGGEIRQAQRDDPRITRFGAFLRKTSLDELPQLFNVLKGEMSLVGPRPHALAHNEEYKQRISRYVWRHKVRPGLTGWAQVNGWRGETDTLEKMQKRVEHDLWYIANWSIWLDIQILLKTVWIVLTRKNAY